MRRDLALQMWNDCERSHFAMHPSPIRRYTTGEPANLLKQWGHSCVANSRILCAVAVHVTSMFFYNTSTLNSKQKDCSCAKQVCQSSVVS